jgi:hypothetical protein
MCFTFRVKNLFKKNLNLNFLFLFLFLFKINNFFMFLYHFNVVILKIIFLKKYYFNLF